ncbi:MAG: hypothetical protein JWQ71_193 [Pedosphaera sp.]|nr:hypothetical protein [Pedosphaera sp.]
MADIMTDVQELRVLEIDKESSHPELGLYPNRN